MFAYFHIYRIKYTSRPLYHNLAYENRLEIENIDNFFGIKGRGNRYIFADNTLNIKDTKKKFQMKFIED